MQISKIVCGLTLVFGWLVFGVSDAVVGQEAGKHEHQAGIKPPTVFLDKSPKIVEYQLKRLSNAQLLLIPRDDQDAKFTPVHAAILARPGMSSEQREEALAALGKLQKSTAAIQLMTQLTKLSEADRQQLRVGNELTSLLLKSDLSPENIGQELREAATSPAALARRAALAGLIVSQRLDVCRDLARADESANASLMAAIPIVPSQELRQSFRTEVTQAIVNDTASSVRRLAILALPSVSVDPQVDFELLSQIATGDKFDSALREAAVQSSLSLNLSTVAKTLAAQVAGKLVVIAEATPAAERTSATFIDSSQLIDRLLLRLDEAEARQLRQRMRAIAVRVVRIKTVEEEMRYDLKYFAAEAGRPIQVVLQNEDLMPHNIVFTMPEKLKEIAIQAAAMAPDAMTDGKQYVPESELVLAASKMVQAGKQETLTFDAPKEPGEYPFVCTFPNHWMRMYGVMVVVADLDQYLAQPIKEPKDPIGNNRSFVKNWKVDDFVTDLPKALSGRSAEIGAKLFQEATCLQCHKFKGTGGAVGPDLTEVFTRQKQDHIAVLRELLDPSAKIDPKYASHSVLTVNGQVYSGVIVAEDDKSISLVNNPDQPKPTLVKRDEIDEMVQSPKSIMPAALLDQFSKEEIFELLSYLSQ